MPCIQYCSRYNMPVEIIDNFSWLITDARVINPLPSGAFNETVLCNLCSEATTKYLIAIGMYIIYVLVLE